LNKEKKVDEMLEEFDDMVDDRGEN